ncbi:hypothetical protein BN85402310 [Alteracholeplasma palmae J233]|uniref:PucR C-terminal helix-turn-helix domain-containing protein n=1 Tax=Alteracholeplasma palmae (strain ATCC 49389 / J233) TaxID=1318466 RepID=U4KJZ5_ALTPJ|nr:helix-turn-helix domain-containing protein [Alteracholeplasma palmae]CCV63808.1 hypothetical protein BN85402310 [Alteracholeplasma palmae J233]
MSLIILRIESNTTHDMNIFSIAKDLFLTIDCLNIGSDWIIHTKETKEHIKEGLNNLYNDLMINFIGYIGNDDEDIELIRSILPKKVYKRTVYDEKKIAQYVIKNNIISEFHPFKKYKLNHEILETIKAFLENNMNVSKTAEKMYLHRNTLIQRLEKFKRDTNYDLKKFEDAFICSYYLIPEI